MNATDSHPTAAPALDLLSELRELLALQLELAQAATRSATAVDELRSLLGAYQMAVAGAEEYTSVALNWGNLIDIAASRVPDCDIEDALSTQLACRLQRLIARMEAAPAPATSSPPPPPAAKRSTAPASRRRKAVARAAAAAG